MKVAKVICHCGSGAVPCLVRGDVFGVSIFFKPVPTQVVKPVLCVGGSCAVF